MENKINTANLGLYIRKNVFSGLEEYIVIDSVLEIRMNKIGAARVIIISGIDSNCNE